MTDSPATDAPGAVFEGNSEMQAIIDERADDAQRRTFTTVLDGRDTAQRPDRWRNKLRPSQEEATSKHVRKKIPALEEVLDLRRIPSGYDAFTLRIADGRIAHNERETDRRQAILSTQGRRRPDTSR